MPPTERIPAVVHLQVNLQHLQRDYFKESTTQQAANAKPPATTTTRFFNLCATDEFASKALFADIPKYYTRNASAKIWQRRKRRREVEAGMYETSTIGRIYTVGPKKVGWGGWGGCYLHFLLLSVLELSPLNC